MGECGVGRMSLVPSACGVDFRVNNPNGQELSTSARLPAASIYQELRETPISSSTTPRQHPRRYRKYYTHCATHTSNDRPIMADRYSFSLTTFSPRYVPFASSYAHDS